MENKGEGAMKIEKMLGTIKKEDDISDIIIRTSAPFLSIKKSGEWERMDDGDLILTANDILNYFDEGAISDLHEKQRIFDFRCSIEIASERRRGRGSVMYFGDEKNMAVIIHILPEVIIKLDQIEFFEKSVGEHPGGDTTQIRQWMSCKTGGAGFDYGVGGVGENNDYVSIN